MTEVRPKKNLVFFKTTVKIDVFIIQIKAKIFKVVSICDQTMLEIKYKQFHK